MLVIRDREGDLEPQARLHYPLGSVVREESGVARQESIWSSAICWQIGGIPVLRFSLQENPKTAGTALGWGIVCEDGLAVIVRCARDDRRAVLELESFLADVEDAGAKKRRCRGRVAEEGGQVPRNYSGDISEK